MVSPHASGWQTRTSDTKTTSRRESNKLFSISKKKLNTLWRKNLSFPHRLENNENFPQTNYVFVSVKLHATKFEENFSFQWIQMQNSNVSSHFHIIFIVPTMHELKKVFPFHSVELLAKTIASIFTQVVFAHFFPFHCKYLLFTFVLTLPLWRNEWIMASRSFAELVFTSSWASKRPL